MNGPAPGLVSDFIGWDGVFAGAAIVAVFYLAAWARRWVAESRRLDQDIADLAQVDTDQDRRWAS